MRPYWDAPRLRYMVKLDVLGDYGDANGNVIESPRRLTERVTITFRGSNNRLTVHPESALTRLTVTFHGDNGVVNIGHNSTVGKPQLNLRVGHRSRISLGDNVSTTTMLFVSAVEGTAVAIGDDVMCATHNQIRTDDSHGIYDVTSRERINPALDVTIGDHVWLGYEAMVLRGSVIGPGSVIGMRSVVTSHIPNNCVAVGAPAKVVRQNIARERPYLWLSEAPDPWPDSDLPPHWQTTNEQSY